MQRIDWGQTGLVAAGAVVGLLLLVAAWKVAKLLFKGLIALVFLILLSVGAWYWIRQAN